MDKIHAEDIPPYVLQIHSDLQQLCDQIVSGHYTHPTRVPLSKPQVADIINRVRMNFPLTGIMFAPVCNYADAQKYLEHLVHMGIWMIVSVGSGNAIFEAVLVIVAYFEDINVSVVCSDPQISTDLPDVPALTVYPDNAEKFIQKHCVEHPHGVMVLAVYPPLDLHLKKADAGPTNIGTTCKKMGVPLTIVGEPYPPSSGGNVGENTLWESLAVDFIIEWGQYEINNPNLLGLHDAIVVHVPNTNGM